MFQLVILYCFTSVCVPWFFSRDSVLRITIKFRILIFLLFHIFEIVFAWLCSLLIMLSRDVEINPGPKKKDKECLSICHGNLNSISAYDYPKLFVLNSYNSLHKFDIIYLCETYLNSKLLLMITIWKSLVTRLLVLIIHLIPNAEVSVFTTKTIYL